jgi:ribose transport system permease protein
MTTASQPIDRAGRRSLGESLRGMMRNYPIIPLIVLLLTLVAALEFLQPGIVLRENGILGLNDRWISNTVKFAIPLAILAGAQTLTMITGGIDLSVGVVATMTAFVMATQVASGLDPVLAIPLALGCAALAGLASGIGVALFRVHPLIMTLAIGIVVEGFLLVYQRGVLGVSAKIPEAITWLGTGRSGIPALGIPDIIPNSLLVFIPVALFIGYLLRRTGFGRNLYAVGDNEGASRLAGVRVWQVLIVLYVLSAVLAGIGGLVYVGLIKATTLSLAVPLMLPSVAAAVIGGTSIFGGRGGYAGTIVGALILQVLASMLTVLRIEEGTRRIIFGLIILGVTALYVRITQERQG